MRAKVAAKRKLLAEKRKDLASKLIQSKMRGYSSRKVVFVLRKKT